MTKDTIEKEFQYYVKTVYPGRTIDEVQLSQMRKVFVAGLLVVFALRKEMEQQSGVTYVDGHCNEIIAQIDKFTQKRDNKHLEAAHLIKDAKELRRMAAQPRCVTTVALTVEAACKDDRAQELGKQIKRLEEKVLPVWKRKLAEFQTDIIPGIIDDRSVPDV